MFYEKSADEKEYYFIRKRAATASSGGHFTPPHFHDAYELMIVESGSVDAVLNAEARTLHAGEIAFVDKRVAHSFYFGDSEWHSLIFSDEYCHMLRRGNTTLPAFPESLGVSAEILSLLARFYTENPNGDPSALCVESLVCSILALIESASGRIPIKDGDTNVTRILAYMNAHSSEPLTLRSVAAEFGYTPNYFSTLFASLYGMSFKDYLNCIRYRSAEQMIKTERSSAAFAAEKSGFGSMNSFYRAKKRFGEKNS